jgi:hypothetical protein
MTRAGSKRSGGKSGKEYGEPGTTRLQIVRAAVNVMCVVDRVRRER